MFKFTLTKSHLCEKDRGNIYLAYEEAKMFKKQENYDHVGFTVEDRDLIPV